MYERDYGGGMEFYQRQLLKKGITREMLDMDDFAGCTASELQSIVDSAYIVRNPALRGGEAR